MINKCKICGKEFNARQSNHTLCSDECRKENRKRVWQKIKADPYLHKQHKIRANKYNIAKRKANPKPHKRCIQCGGDTGSYYAKYCLDCLLDNYFKSPNGVNYSRLNNRGFDRGLIEEEAEIRGAAIPETRQKKEVIK